MIPEPSLVLAERQRGVLARYQLVAEMASDDEADNLLRSNRFGPLDPPVRGVHRVRGGAALPEQAAFGAALRARPAAVVTGPMVLGLLGVEGFTTSAPFEILRSPSRSLHRAPFLHRADPDPGRPVAMYGEVRVAGPVDALVDAAAFVDDVGERALRVAWDQLRWRGLAKRHRLVARMAELQGTSPGPAILSRVLEMSGGLDHESEGERGLGAVLACFEPRPEAQVWVTPRRRVDHYFRALRTGFEYLGNVDHGSVAGRITDDERDTELRQEGVRLHYVTGPDLHEPRTLLANVAGILTVRAHELGVTPPVAARPLPGPRAA